MDFRLSDNEYYSLLDDIVGNVGAYMKLHTRYLDCDDKLKKQIYCTFMQTHVFEIIGIFKALKRIGLREVNISLRKKAIEMIDTYYVSRDGELSSSSIQAGKDLFTCIRQFVG